MRRYIALYVVAGVGLLAFGLIYAAVAGGWRLPSIASLPAGGALLALSLALYSAETARFFRKGPTRYGLATAVAVLLVLGILVFVEAMSARHHARLDLTRSRRFTLASQTIKILQNLDQPVRALAFYPSDGGFRRQARDLLEQYADRSALFSFELVDPDLRPATAREYGITTYASIILERGELRQKVDALTEQDLTNALLKVTRDSKKTIYFLAGHGEPALDGLEDHGYNSVRQALLEENYQVEELFLMRAEGVPEEASVVVWAGPQSDPFPVELDELDRYLAQGGKLFLLTDPETVPALKPFLLPYGARLADDYVVDRMSRLFGGDYLMPVVGSYPLHPITEGFRIATFFPLARSIQPAPEEAERRGGEVQSIAMTGENSWGETNLAAMKEGTASLDEGDIPGPVSLAVAAEFPAEGAQGEEGEEGTGSSDKTARLVVVGDSDFANNANLGLSGNRDLFLNIVNWLAEEEDLVAIRPKDEESEPLVLSAAEARLIFWLPVVALPAAVLGVGIGIYTRRRRNV